MKNIWITGAGSGIGKQLALKLAGQGHNVIVSGRDGNKLDQTARKFPENILAVTFDVTDEKQIRPTQKTIAGKVGHLDLVILSAGTCEYIDNTVLDIEKFRRVFDTNLFGSVNTVNVALPLLQKAPKDKKLVAISSLSTVVGLPRAEAYGASKAAQNYFFNSLRLDMSRYDIDVMVVNPGFVKTPLTEKNDFPMPFLQSAEKAAERIMNVLFSSRLQFSFPLRLHVILKLASLFPSLWYRFVGPKMIR